MNLKTFTKYLALSISLCVSSISFGQDVPLGIFYQAVARDNFGKELTSKDIDVKFSIISGNPLGTLVYQELHSDVITSKYGVFSLIIGKGIPTGGTFGELSQVNWSQAYHYLKVEVKFDNDFVDMGTMQFLAVPYALYARKSLEPGPAGPKGDTGPKGDPGDPASDNQALSVINVDGSDYLAISGGNQVKISSIERDGDPTNELQDLTINSDKLKITKNPMATEWDLSRYLDNTDSQALLWNATTRVLSISGNAGTINLSELKNDADADPTNELQSLTYDQSNNSLSISGRNSVVIGNMIAFRAQKLIATSAPMPLSNIDFIPDQVEYNDGSALNVGTGEFTAGSTGLYTFDIKYIAPSTGDGRMIMLFKNGNLYENLESSISKNTTLFRTITIKLLAADKIKLVIYTGTGTDIGTGVFSGYKVY